MCGMMWKLLSRKTSPIPVRMIPPLSGLCRHLRPLSLISLIDVTPAGVAPLDATFLNISDGFSAAKMRNSAEHWH